MMTRCVLLAAALFLGLVLSASAQQSPRSALTLHETAGYDEAGLRRSFVGGPSHSAIVSLQSFAQPDAQRFSLSNAFGWLGASPAPEYLPAFVAQEPRRILRAPIASPEADGKDVAVPFDPVSVHGEVGFLYGRSTGRRGGAVKQGYIIGEVGNDKVQITAGASYEEASGRFSRLRSW